MGWHGAWIEWPRNGPYTYYFLQAAQVDKLHVICHGLGPVLSMLNGTWAFKTTSGQTFLTDLLNRTSQDGSYASFHLRGILNQGHVSLKGIRPEANEPEIKWRWHTLPKRLLTGFSSASRNADPRVTALHSHLRHSEHEGWMGLQVDLLINRQATTTKVHEHCITQAGGSHNNMSLYTDLMYLFRARNGFIHFHMQSHSLLTASVHLLMSYEYIVNAVRWISCLFCPYFKKKYKK